ncbi:hypothetical protein AVEN_30252-1 [Araneus ventricosus]|uniref:Uncharacterized protein n=1 Tax=Araneus ventricosus TaxID=182803 RepID=A0A4Y2EK21_ARAVE|nr:hypothetical protein AVEN_30252-1 [Araneus ventricosus]
MCQERLFALAVLKIENTIDIDFTKLEIMSSEAIQSMNGVESVTCFARESAFSFQKIPGGRGGLVVRSRLWGRRAPGSKPDSTEDPPCMGPVAR